MSGVDAQITDAVTQAAKGIFIGDAMSMPVHWYYNVPQIKEDFNGWITKYEKPKDVHPGVSALKLPDPVTFQGKNGPESVQLLGDVIIKDQAHAYAKDSKVTHYHQGLNAGDNTLNYYCTLRVWRTLKSCDASMSEEEVVKRILSDYVTFMTTAGSHQDTWADGFHKSFFGDWLKAGSPTDPNALYKFATERSQEIYANPSAHKEHLPYIEAFTMPLPIILRNIHKPMEEFMKAAKMVYSIVHPVAEVTPAIDSFNQALYAVVRGASLKDEAEKAFLKFSGADGPSLLKKFDKMVNEATDKLSAFQAIGAQLGISCGIVGGYPILLYIARHYHNDFEGGILTNVNVGGDNCGRAGPLGALLGAALGAKGQKVPTKWTDQLVLNSAIDQLFTD